VEKGVISELRNTLSVLRGTLDKCVKDTARSPEELVNVHLGRRTVLRSELENKLVEYSIIVRRQDIERMAFQLAIISGLKQPFNQGKSVAGKKCFRSFLKGIRYYLRELLKAFLQLG
jgi:hypothetical protein